MQHIKNVIPTFHIIAESKINEEGIRAFFSKSKPDFFTNLEEKNKIKISDGEKLIEAVGNVCDVLHSERTKNNKEYLSYVNSHANEMLNHTFVTVAFNNVSQTFLDKMHRMHAKIEIHQRELGKEELKFWLLPTYDDDKDLAFRFAELFESYGTLKVKLETDLASKKERVEEKDLECIKRLLPNTYALDAVITTNILVWKELMIKYTDLQYDDEIRYILLFMAKAFKQKYANVFQNIMITDQTGNTLGLDSLKTDGKIWRVSKVIKI